MNRPNRPYDIVLFGATGFVGTLTAEYLAAHAPESLRWAVAGRDERRLRTLRERLPGGAGIGVLTADVGDPRSLRHLAGSAGVVASTVGPYIRYGGELVAACADSGTDYLDLTGEPEFVDLMTSVTTRAPGRPVPGWCTPVVSTRCRPISARTSPSGSCRRTYRSGWTATSAWTRPSPAAP